MYIDNIINKLMYYGVRREDMIGCTMDEIRELEIILNHKLPEAYKEFLLTMGHGVGDKFLNDANLLYNCAKNHVLRNKEYIVETNEDLVDDDQNNLIPDDAFFFITDGGEHDHAYFRLDDPNPDPAIFACLHLQHRKVTDRFTEYLNRIIDSSKMYMDYTSSANYKDMKDYDVLKQYLKNKRSSS